MRKATKELYLNYLKQSISEDEGLHHDGCMNHAIYMIDDIVIGGGFYDGLRSNDHYCLLNIDYKDNSTYISVNGERYAITWDDILTWGIVLVPETQTYINNSSVMDLDELGYMRLPLDNNHIKGGYGNACNDLYS